MRTFGRRGSVSQKRPSRPQSVHNISTSTVGDGIAPTAPFLILRSPTDAIIGQLPVLMVESGSNKIQKL
jgi:hypothetical protein